MANIVEIADSPETVEQKREAALWKIVNILEDHMEAAGLSASEKNQKTIELCETVTEAVRAKLQPPAKRRAPLQIVASEA